MSAAAAAPVSGASTEKQALIDGAVARAGKLAALPEVAMEVMRLVRDPKATGDDLVRVLSNDPALSVRVLKIVNSAYYGMRREVTSISSAIFVMGFGVINNIAVAASMARMFRVRNTPAGFEPRDLWTHAVAVAVATRSLAARLKGVDPNEAFLAGLVHDIGIIVELQACTNEFGALVNATAENPARSFQDAEVEIVGATHEDFGEALCRTWRFPDELVRVSGHHHRPMTLPADKRRTTAMVYVADHLAAEAALGYSRSVEAGGIDPAVVAWLGATDEDLAHVRETLPGLVGETMPLMSEG